MSADTQGKPMEPSKESLERAKRLSIHTDLGAAAKELAERKLKMESLNECSETCPKCRLLALLAEAEKCDLVERWRKLAVFGKEQYGDVNEPGVLESCADELVTWLAVNLPRIQAETRLEEFHLIKRERPANPCYWDAHHERELTAQADELHAIAEELRKGEAVKICPRCKCCEIVREECDQCDEGLGGHDCGEDCCCCEDPEPNIQCQFCQGRGYHEVCIGNCDENGKHAELAAKEKP